MFLISISLILISSYLITSLLKQEKNNFIYLFLVAFSQIVLSFEILSLFSLISKNNFLICNILFFVIALIIKKITNSKLYIPNFKKEFTKIKNALKKDKLLFFIAICFVIFIISTLYITLNYPITFGDALNYTFSRCTTWIQNGNLNHFITPDTREIIMPINIELLYTWFFLFAKEEIGTGIFSFIAYILGIYLIYNLLGTLHFCRRKRLWSVFVFSSFALIGVMAYTPCSDIFIGTLILCSIYLFLLYCKTDNKINLYFSSLAYILAIGSKTTAIMIIPSVAIIFLCLLIKYKKDKLKETILFFIVISAINFLLFSSYNYVLNFLHFLHPISNNENLLIHKSFGGFKAFLCNFIKYCFVIFDMSGIRNIDFYNVFITNLQTKMLSLIGETPNSYMSNFFSENFKYNSLMTIATSGLGALGLFAFLPSLLKAKRNFVLSLLALSLLINIVVISKTMIFCQFNIRYIAAFITIASPVLVFSYIKSNKNIYKFILVFFIFMYLFVIPHKKAISYFLNSKTVNITRDELIIYDYFIQKDKTNIALISAQQEQSRYDIEKLKLYGFKIDKLLVEKIEDFDLTKYSYLITDTYKTTSTDIYKYNVRQNKKLFVSPCIYVDSNLNIIEDYENKEPAKVDCLIPFAYFREKGFIIQQEIKLDKYVILKNNR